MRFLSTTSSAILLPALSLSIGTAANEQLILEEVIVTAQKREQSLQDAPISIAVLNEDQLVQIGISSLQDLESGIVPSLRVSPNGNVSTSLAITIRGNGPIDTTQATRESAVAVYQDGVYIGRTQALSMELTDLERIEVLRGPQGTLFGRNATGGAISLISKKPTGKLGIEQTFGVGRYDAWRSLTRLNLPEVAGIRSKIDYLHTERGGWVDNTAAGQADYGEIEKSGGRLSLSARPSRTVSLDYTYDNATLESTQVYFQLYEDTNGIIGRERQRQSRTRYPIAPLDPTQTDIRGHGLTIDWALNNQVKFRSISGYRDVKEDSNNNYGGVLYNNGLIVAEDTRQAQLSQEFQLIGNQEPIQWVAGLYYFREDVEQDIQFLFSLDTSTELPFAPIDPPGGTPITFVDSDATSLAAYGQATWSLDRLHVTLGGRYTEDEKLGKRFQFATQEFDLKTEHFDTAVTLQYDWFEDISSYIKWGTAYKAGGFNIRSASFSPFDEQVTKTWEIGLKSQLWGQRLRINTALFRSNYKDMQFDFVDPVNVVIIETINAEKTVKLSGFEMDFTAMLTDELILGLNYTYLDDDMPLQPNPLANGERQQFEIIQTPQHAGSLTLDYTFPLWSLGKLRAHLNITSTDQYAHSPVTSPRLDAYTLINARLTLSEIPIGRNSGAFSIAIWGKNLADEEYAALGFPIGSPAVTTIQAFGTPRTAGLDISYKF